MTQLGTLKVKFGYDRSKSQKPKTTITIMNQQNEVLVETFVAKSKNDLDDKRTARFQAFRKGMNHLALRGLATKQQRTEAWRTFVASVTLPNNVLTLKPAVNV